MVCVSLVNVLTVLFAWNYVRPPPPPVVLVPCQCDRCVLHTNTVNCWSAVCVRCRVKITDLFGHPYSRCNWHVYFCTNYKNDGSFYKCPRYEILCHISVQKGGFLRSWQYVSWSNLPHCCRTKKLPWAKWMHPNYTKCFIEVFYCPGIFYEAT
jgi:hypothetical protein